jgi:hypothetical protein
MVPSGNEKGYGVDSPARRAQRQLMELSLENRQFALIQMFLMITSDSSVPKVIPIEEKSC